MVTDAMVEAAQAELSDDYLWIGLRVPDSAMRAAIEAALDAAWVPCAAQMPQEGVEVLVWHAPIRERLLARWNGVEWFETWSGDVLDCDGVTHWAPLPAPPGTFGRREKNA